MYPFKEKVSVKEEKKRDIVKLRLNRKSVLYKYNLTWRSFNYEK